MMDSIDKHDRDEQLFGTGSDEQGREKVNSESEIDIFNTTPESSAGEEKSVSGSHVDLVTGEVTDATGSREIKPDPGTGGFSDSLASALEDHKTETGSNRINPGVRHRSNRSKGKWSLFMVLVIALFIGVGFFYVKYGKYSSNGEKLNLVTKRNVFPIPKGELIAFDPFIVPFNENERFTYMSLSIVIGLPNKELRYEINGKRDRIRGILYDMFLGEINRENRIPPIDHLKKSIIRTVNGALSGGEVKEVYVTQYLAV